MNMVFCKQVINIEYVGPHQIQDTSFPSVNFSARIDSKVNDMGDGPIHLETGLTDDKKEKTLLT